MAPELAFQVQRHSTIDAHRQAVERVISEMRARFDEPLSLHDMARIACISPFHFERVFHQITGLPAVQFLYALRIEAAKRMLLTTTLSITEVCYEVGYNSLGTFTSRFTQLVGLSPRHFRRLAGGIDSFCLTSCFRNTGAFSKSISEGSSVTGRVLGTHWKDSWERLVFVGLFPTLIPQCRPVGGTLLKAAGNYHIAPVPDGKYYVFVAAFPVVKDPMSYFLPDPASLLVGVGTRPVTVGNGNCGESVDVPLRPLQITDPPILIALPVILMEILSQESMTD